MFFFICVYVSIVVMDYWVETGETAGRIFESVKDNGGCMTLAQLKKKIKCKTFDYSIGWLLREDRVWLESKGRSVKVHIN